jgi:hypothetical protein
MSKVPASTAPPFDPENALERALLLAQQGKASVGEVLKLLVASSVYVLSETEVMRDGRGGLNPVFFNTPDGQFMAVFTSLERSKVLASKAPFCLMVTGAQVLDLVPANCGLVINPGLAVGFQLPASGIPAVRRDFLGGEKN